VWSLLTLKLVRGNRILASSEHRATQTLRPIICEKSVNEVGGSVTFRYPFKTTVNVVLNNTSD